LASRNRHALRALAMALFTSACAHPVLPPSPATTAPISLVKDLDAILNDPVLAHGTWGVMVKSLKTAETLYARNERRLLMPASNMKIATVAAAAERLGWDYTYTTRLMTAGRIDNGVLAGDLVVVGSGDPSIGLIDGSSERLFDTWAAQLKQLGIRTVTGRIVGDDNAFEDLELGFGWSWDDLADDYAAGIGALQFNENAVRVSVAPGPRAGDAAAVIAEPAGSGVEIVSTATTAAAESQATLSAQRLPGSQRLRIAGTIALGTSRTLTVSVDNPTLFFVRAIRTALIARGIDVRGRAVDIDDIADSPQSSQTLVDAHRSPPLSEMAVRLMKISQNQYAETFFKTLTAGAGVANAYDARAIEDNLFSQWGVHPGGLIIRDGSGLSRYDYVTADALIAILTHIYDDPRLRTPFEATLPVIGVDGTLGNRMKGTAAERNARAKSGSMSNVRALSGYVTTADGEPLAFSILANNFETAADIVNKATDAIVVRLATHRR
jgi:D-alanyl-D-alanine carboxypeptidase/D-alanyl-D-alanine-endopeptidase (penicillin-binding protein 4)